MADGDDEGGVALRAAGAFAAGATVVLPPSVPVFSSRPPVGAAQAAGPTVLSGTRREWARGTERVARRVHARFRRAQHGFYGQDYDA